MTDMDNNLFWELYDNGLIKVKVFDGEIGYDKITVEAFQYNCKFYLRISTIHDYVIGGKDYGRKYKMCRMSSYIRKFNNSEYANNYFKKVSKGKLKRVI